MTSKFKTDETGVTINDMEIHGNEKIEATNQVAMGLIMTLAAMVGIWGAACFIGGIAASGGIFEMARLWISSITGM